MEFDMVSMQSEYFEALRNEVRDKDADAETLKRNLLSLGRLFGQEIAAKYFLKKGTVSTPMGIALEGIRLRVGRVVVVSTSDDYEYFGKGIADALPRAERGQMNFSGVRGPEALTSPIRSVTLPDVDCVDMVVVAKAVLATGCTAVTLARKAMDKYCPHKLVVASVFYSDGGVAELRESLKTAEVIVAGEADDLRQDGMLVPGVGDLDDRVNGLSHCA